MTDPRETLLDLLSAGGWVSGERLGDALGISRAAVWKHVDRLRDEGYEIEAKPREGYRLLGSPDLLVPWEIKRRSTARVMGAEIHHFLSVDSTNSVARALAREGAPEGTLVVAEEQTGGRGRLGRGWFSPRGLGNWSSLILRPGVPALRGPGITFAAGVATAEAIEAVTGLAPGLKWPNDILLNGKKVVGILTEMVTGAEWIEYVILGVGVNVNQPGDAFPGDLAASATSLRAELGRVISRSQLMAASLAAVEKWYGVFLDGGMEEILPAWRSRWLHRGKGVEISSPSGRLRGVAMDVDEMGALMLRTTAGTRERVLAGDLIVPAASQGELPPGTAG